MGTDRKKVLITGAAGDIGRYLTEHLGADYDLLLTDIRDLEQPGEHPFVKCDLVELDKLRELCRGIDTVLHLGANRDYLASWEELLEPNIIGAYTIFQAAYDAGCRRLIFASSCHTVLGYPIDVQAHTHMPVRPKNLYGATKVWGEALGRYYADLGLSTICVRIGWAMKKGNQNLTLQNNNLHLVLTYEDMALLFSCCINAPDDLQFLIVNGLSNNRWKRLDISNANEVLGYQPQDDAFSIAEEIARLAREKQKIKMTRKIRSRAGYFLRKRRLMK